MPNSWQPQEAPCLRDIFLSHSSVDNELAGKLSREIEGFDYQGRKLTTWLDEAEVKPGSIPGSINRGLECSRFIGIIMTPAYFESQSGWTDAEWHAALHMDPDNREGRIVPILAKDCPYIPCLLRHLLTIDMREEKHAAGLEQLISVLQAIPIPSAIAHRGQLILPSGNISRETLVAERSVLEADPDVVEERLYCNLLPLDKLARQIYSAPVAKHLCRQRESGEVAFPTKAEVKLAIRKAQEEKHMEKPFMPAFRMSGGNIVTFHDLEDPENALAPVVDEEKTLAQPTSEWVQDHERRKLLISLLNMAVARHARRVGLEADTVQDNRYHFPPDGDGPRFVTWKPFKKTATREVAGPRVGVDGSVFWRHQAAYLEMVFLSNRFFLKARPTWVFTDDGIRVKSGPELGRLAIRWTGAERNIHILYHIQFWISTLRRKMPGPMVIRAGDQYLEFSTRPAFVQQAYGIRQDQKDLYELLDDEADTIEMVETDMLNEVAERIGLGGSQDEPTLEDNPQVEDSPEAGGGSDE